jgi:carbohydrate kinase (thermoresistant glucokinase family)
MIVVVMGVCGCGKTSVGRRIAERMGWIFIEGDDLHPESNKQKMAAGTPLEDADRWPWLDRIVARAREIEVQGGSSIIACSALKRIYRDRLRRAGSDVRFVYLEGDRDLIGARMRARRDHFMPAGLLDSQLATLEPPGASEAAYTFDVALPVERIVDGASAAIR